jgi:uncharacterized protein (DUF1330 family)
MPAYVIALQRELHEGPDMDAYRRVNSTVLERHGGRFVVRGGNPVQLEGDAPIERAVVMEFPDRAAAQAWYDDPDYREAIPLRLANSTTSLVIADGFDG